MGIPEREGREKGTEKIFEMIMTANLPKLMSDSKELIQEAQRTPSRINGQKTTHRHINFKLQITKGKKRKEA